MKLTLVAVFGLCKLMPEIKHQTMRRCDRSRKDELIEMSCFLGALWEQHLVYLDLSLFFSAIESRQLLQLSVSRSDLFSKVRRVSRQD